jgi:hypothetical protein
MLAGRSRKRRLRPIQRAVRPALVHLTLPVRRLRPHLHPSLLSHRLEVRPSRMGMFLLRVSVIVPTGKCPVGCAHGYWQYGVPCILHALDIS